MTSITPVSAGVRLAGLSLLLLGQLAEGQTIAPAPAATEGASLVPAAPPATPSSRLERDTMVSLMVLTEVNSHDSQPGHQFKLRVHQPVLVDGRTVIPEGALAIGEVASAQRTGAVGQAGELGVRLLHVEVDGTRIRLDGQRATTGRSATDKVVLSVLGFGVLGLLAKGNNAKLKAGDLIEGNVAETMIFTAGRPPVVAGPETPALTVGGAVATPPLVVTPAVKPAEAKKLPLR